jgi:alanine racemase
MKSSRRSFLEAGLALPAILNTVPTLTETSRAKIIVTKDSSFDPWVEIHRENLRHNVQEIVRRAGARPILAVIKNNGYGMGVTNVAQLLEPQFEIFGFAVAKFHEAMSLRDAGIRKPVLLMGPFDEKIWETRRHATSCRCSTRRWAPRWIRLRRNCRSRLHCIFAWTQASAAWESRITKLRH